MRKPDLDGAPWLENVKEIGIIAAVVLMWLFGAAL